MINLFVKILIISAISISCSNAGETQTSGSPAVSNDTPVNLNSALVSGIIKGPSGSQTELSNWIVGFSEIGSQVVHLGKVSPVGYYQVAGVNLNNAQTMFLLTYDYRLKAVLAAPGSTSTSLYQYFMVNTVSLPAMLYANKVLTFEDSSVFDWTGSEVVDGDGNLVPDGLYYFSLTSQLGFNLSGQDSATLSTTDMDYDGLTDTADYDVDGDSLANWMDTDDDNDGIPDWVDPDANGDGILDSTDPYLEQIYPYGLESFSVQLKYTQVLVVGSSNTWEKEFVFQATASPKTEVDSVRMMGSNNLFYQAQKIVMSADPDTPSAPRTWDNSLLDDGLSEDGIADDGIYGSRVKLAATAQIVENETVFFDVTSGSEKYQFGFAMPDVTINPFTTTVNEYTRTITAYQITQPIGAADFYWYANVYDEDDNLKYQSQIISDSSVTSTVIPNSVIIDSATDYVKVVFYSTAHAQSSPTIVVESANIPF